MFNPMSLEGKRILVTGASSGIGRATAIYASRLGATLVLTARREQELEATRSQTERPDAHQVVVGDLTDAAFCAQVVARAGKLDGLVHSAGFSLVAPLGAMPRAKVDEAMRVNVGAFLELMTAAPQSDIRGETFSAVAVSSVSAQAGWAGGAAYAAAKGALSAAVRAMAVELAPKGVRVNAVCPSTIDTPLIAPMKALDPAGFLEKVRRDQPLGMGRPEQVASVLCFLLSDASSFMTGAEIPVDGGYLAR